ncbi:hypothetical protein L3Y34_009679 [Caenorhabditis briggsae]|uniref:Uncharacterized protein n=1 Tax=Caenorhabditis briggsae TaxID=6238 RepID=A0AAE9A7S2_CAEBR|nr:hypothetical protein L3Y34_009679 [Caenorhabditis briggsae]
MTATVVATMPGDEAADTIKKVIGYVDQCVEAGQFLFPEMKESFEIISKLGKAISALTELAPPDEDPVMKKLGELEGKIDTLADKMNAKFSDLKAFMTETKFNEDVIQPATKLMQYIMDTFKHPSKKATENFLESYKKNKPLDLAYSVMSKMQQDTTNPLYMSMEADLIKTETTFNKWKNIITGALGQFLFVEAFASGLQDSKDTNDRDRMNECSANLNTDMDALKDKYKAGDAYWKGMKTYIQQFQEDTSKLTHKDRADKLISILNTILTNESLYLVISDSSPNINDFSMWKGVDDQTVESYEKGGCNIIVYRSKKANTLSVGEFWDMQHACEACETGKIKAKGSCSGHADTLHDNIPMAKFIVLIWDARHPEVRSCLTPGHEWGPGYTMTVEAGETPWAMKMKLAMVAGFP